jgi:anion-transporting  ArsA/GET3 family ATPase
LGLLLTQDYPEYTKSKSMLLKYLDDVQTLRNIMAHKTLAESDDFIKKFDGQTVYFNIYETDKYIPTARTEMMDESELDKFDMKIKYISDQLIELHSKIGKSRSTERESGEVSNT